MSEPHVVPETMVVQETASAEPLQNVESSQNVEPSQNVESFQRVENSQHSTQQLVCEQTANKADHAEQHVSQAEVSEDRSLPPPPPLPMSPAPAAPVSPAPVSPAPVSPKPSAQRTSPPPLKRKREGSCNSESPEDEEEPSCRKCLFPEQ